MRKKAAQKGSSSGKASVDSVPSGRTTVRPAEAGSISPTMAAWMPRAWSAARIPSARSLGAVATSVPSLMEA